MNAAPSEVPVEPEIRSADTVLYPKDSPERPVAAAADTSRSGGAGLLAGAFLLALGGGWLLLLRRRRGLPLARLVRSGRLIAIEETKSLGNRQYLVVAGCEGRRFLLGVTPGQIQLLSPLDSAEDAEDEEGESIQASPSAPSPGRAPRSR